MVKWKTVLFIYLFLFLALAMATSYQISSKVVNQEEFVDEEIVTSENYNWTKLLEEENKTVLHRANYTVYLFDEKRFVWTVLFKLEESPQHYRVSATIKIKASQDANMSEPNSAGVAINFTFYANGHEIFGGGYELAWSVSEWGWFPWPPSNVDPKYLHRGWNNITAVIHACIWIDPDVNVNGTVSYTIGPFKVTVGELKTVFGLQPDYLFPGAVLLLPISVALEIVVRRFRKKLKRIERVKC